MFKAYTIAAFIVIFNIANGQNLIELEAELERLGLNSVQLRTEEERLAAADTFSMLLDDVLENSETFVYPFEKVKNLSKLTSPDNNFRIYTWSVPLKDGRFAFYGKLVLKEGSQYNAFNLADNAVNIENAEYQLLKTTNWYGAIYYDILKRKEKKTTYYTLLGYRPDNAGHNEKVIEVISSDNLEPIRFGAQIFNTPVLNGIKFERPPYRLIFRYNPRTVALLRYISAEKRIIFDHLVPPDASMTKQWKLYGPDFSYDALFWEDGHWNIEEAIEVKGNVKPQPAQPVQQGLPDK